MVTSQVSPQGMTCSEDYKYFVPDQLRVGTENESKNLVEEENKPNNHFKGQTQQSKIINAIENYGDSQIVWLYLLALLGERHIVKSQLNGRIVDHSRQRLNLSLHSSCGSGNLLRKMLFGSGIVSWQTTRDAENIELVRFNGNIIMSMNSYINDIGELTTRDEYLKVNLDRCVVLTLRPSKDDAISIKK